MVQRFMRDRDDAPDGSIGVPSFTDEKEEDEEQYEKNCPGDILVLESVTEGKLEPESDRKVSSTAEKRTRKKPSKKRYKHKMPDSGLLLDISKEPLLSSPVADSAISPAASADSGYVRVPQASSELASLSAHKPSQMLPPQMSTGMSGLSPHKPSQILPPQMSTQNGYISHQPSIATIGLTGQTSYVTSQTDLETNLNFSFPTFQHFNDYIMTEGTGGWAESQPSGGAESQPSGGAESQPSGGVESQPSGGVESWPSGGVESQPSGGVESWPSGWAESQPSGGVESWPSGGVESWPSEWAESQPPSGGAESQPSKWVESRPSKWVESRPVDLTFARQFSTNASSGYISGTTSDFSATTPSSGLQPCEDLDSTPLEYSDSLRLDPASDSSGRLRLDPMSDLTGLGPMSQSVEMDDLTPQRDQEAPGLHEGGCVAYDEHSCNERTEYNHERRGGGGGGGGCGGKDADISNLNVRRDSDSSSEENSSVFTSNTHKKSSVFTINHREVTSRSSYGSEEPIDDKISSRAHTADMSPFSSQFWRGSGPCGSEGYQSMAPTPSMVEESVGFHFPTTYSVEDSTEHGGTDITTSMLGKGSSPIRHNIGNSNSYDSVQQSAEVKFYFKPKPTV